MKLKDEDVGNVILKMRLPVQYNKRKLRLVINTYSDPLTLHALHSYKVLLLLPWQWLVNEVIGREAL